MASYTTSRRLLRMTRARAVAWVTCGSIAASLLLTLGMLRLFGIQRAEWTAVLCIAGLVPLIIATVIGVIFVPMLHELDHARLLVQEMAIRDSLTGTYNRRHFLELADAEFEKAARHALDLSLLMLDADLFKQINDAHGHQSGDAVLRGISAVAAEGLRDGDILGRYGGEEFVMLLPMTNAAAAAVVAERVRAAIAALRVAQDGQAPLRVTVSIGVSSLTPSTRSMNVLLNHADQAMYRAKANGRNRVEAAPALPPAEGAAG